MESVPLVAADISRDSLYSLGQTVETAEVGDWTNWPLEFTVRGLDVCRKATLRSGTSERRESDDPQKKKSSSAPSAALRCAARPSSFLHTGWTVCPDCR